MILKLLIPFDWTCLISWLLRYYVYVCLPGNSVGRHGFKKEHKNKLEIKQIKQNLCQHHPKFGNLAVSLNEYHYNISFFIKTSSSSFIFLNLRYRHNITYLNKPDLLVYFSQYGILFNDRNSLKTKVN